jgi:hypothetical protein
MARGRSRFISTSPLGLSQLTEAPEFEAGDDYAAPYDSRGSGIPMDAEDELVERLTAQDVAAIQAARLRKVQ